MLSVDSKRGTRTSDMLVQSSYYACLALKHNISMDFTQPSLHHNPRPMSTHHQTGYAFASFGGGHLLLDLSSRYDRALRNPTWSTAPCMWGGQGQRTSVVAMGFPHAAVHIIARRYFTSAAAEKYWDLFTKFQDGRTFSILFGTSAYPWLPSFSRNVCAYVRSGETPPPYFPGSAAWATLT